MMFRIVTFPKCQFYIASVVADAPQQKPQENVGNQEGLIGEVFPSVPSVPSVPAVPPSDNGKGSDLKAEIDDLLKKLYGIARRFESVIPNTENNRFVDLDDSVVMEALSKIMSRVAADEMHKLLITRRTEIEESLKKKRQKLEVDGAVVIVEDDQLAFAIKLVEAVYKKHNDLASRNDSWRQEVREYKKIKSHIRQEVRYGLTYLDKRDKKIYEYVDKMLANINTEKDKPKGIIPPAKPSGDYVGQQFYYLLILLPLYKVRCFLTDRYTSRFFHTILVAAFVVLLSLMGFMAHDIAKLKRESEKYHILRDWVGVDSSEPQIKARHLDALFDDEANNRKEINELACWIDQKRRQN